MNKEALKQHLESTYACGICSNILYEPVTLLCQHTYCRACLKELIRLEPNQTFRPEQRCPTCRRRFFIPESSCINFQMRDAIEELSELVYTEEELQARTQSRRKEELRLELKDQVVKELRQELQEGLIDALNPNFIAGVVADVAAAAGPNNLLDDDQGTLIIDDPYIDGWPGQVNLINSQNVWGYAGPHPKKKPFLDKAMDFLMSPHAVNVGFLALTCAVIPGYIYTTFFKK